VAVPRFLSFGTGFLESVSGVLQTFAHRSFGGLCSVLNSLAGSLRTVLDSFAGLGGAFLDRLASFADGILVLCTKGE
jgi:hypothetical protein